MGISLPTDRLINTEDLERLPPASRKMFDARIVSITLLRCSALS